MNYDEFIKSKTIDAPSAGVDVSQTDIHSSLFEHQRDIVAWALKRGRAAIFAATGLGKTIMQSEWARHIHRATGKNVLILAPLAVAAQTVREAHMIGLDITLCESQKDVKHGVNITNYEKLHKFNAENFVGIVLDESSILKSYTSSTRNAIIEGFQRTPYRLACTATPAPNDYMELGNHSEFLGIMSRTEMLSMFFVHDGGDTSKWRLKGHAEQEFWKWVASWGCMIRKPSDLGYDDGAYELPPLNVRDVVVETGKAPEGYLFAMEVQTLQERQAARRATIEERCRATVDLVNQNPNEKWLIWCDYNSEQEEIKRLLGERCVSIQGSTPDEKRIEMEREWREGDVPVMLTKASIFGFGLNWQHCNHMIFAGLSDSFESQHQAIRRCYRFGQTKPVNVYMVTSDLEGAVAANVKRKEADFEKMQDEMSRYTREIVKANVTSASVTRTVYEPKMTITIPSWLRGA